MNRDLKLQRLQRLQAEVDAIRLELGISAPGSVLYFSAGHSLEDEMIVVEADGFGGATTSVVEGNYPVDYITKFEKEFASEEDAVRIADELTGRGISLDAT